MINKRVAKVFHNSKSNFFTPAKTFNQVEFDLVAAVTFNKAMSVEEALEVAYERTNSIDSHWSNNRGIIMLSHERNHRSTSIGDVILFDGKLYAVDVMGFKEIGEF
jgi:hypothetical protein